MLLQLPKLLGRKASSNLEAKALRKKQQDISMDILPGYDLTKQYNEASSNFTTELL